MPPHRFRRVTWQSRVSLIAGKAKNWTSDLKQLCLLGDGSLGMLMASWCPRQASSSGSLCWSETDLFNPLPVALVALVACFPIFQSVSLDSKLYQANVASIHGHHCWRGGSHLRQCTVTCPSEFLSFFFVNDLWGLACDRSWLCTSCESRAPPLQTQSSILRCTVYRICVRLITIITLVHCTCISHIISHVI